MIEIRAVLGRYLEKEWGSFGVNWPEKRLGFYIRKNKKLVKNIFRSGGNLF